MVVNTGITMRLSVPVGNSTTTRRTWLSLNPPVTSMVPLNDGPSFFTSQTMGNQLASGTMLSKPGKTSNWMAALAVNAPKKTIRRRIKKWHPRLGIEGNTSVLGSLIFIGMLNAPSRYTQTVLPWQRSIVRTSKFRPGHEFDITAFMQRKSKAQLLRPFRRFEAVNPLRRIPIGFAFDFRLPASFISYFEKIQAITRRERCGPYRDVYSVFDG